MIPSLHADHVGESPDLARVRALPTRAPVHPEMVQLMTRAFRIHSDSPVCPRCYGHGVDQTARECKTCGATGKIELRPIQCEALREAYACGGLGAPMRVGSGKTLVTLLLPTLLGARQPVLIVPASLREQTRTTFAALRHAWKVRLPIILSYQALGRAEYETKLDELAPDLVILDECHMTRNWEASVTRRVQRYKVTHPDARMVSLSGTMITDSLQDYQHLLVWPLGEQAPVPIVRAEAERWSQALDRTATLRRVGAGALQTLPGGFHQHLRTRRGLVLSTGSGCDASLEIHTWRPELPAPLRDLITRTEQSSMRPDGELLDEWELPDCLCQLVQGFYYVWDPLPPQWWLEPRRAWRAYVRAVLDEHLDGFDSESMIVNALDRMLVGGDFLAGPRTGLPPCPQEGAALLTAWRAVRDRFVPNTVPVWLDASVLRQAAEHTKEHGAIAWTRHRAAGWALDQLGLPYYGGGTDPDTATPGSPIACSIGAHGTGRNLQRWRANLVLVPPANALSWEQLIGRTHRPGQKADLVRVDIISAIPYHGEVLGRVVSEARSIAKASGFSQKITDATWVA